ncbi:MAG: ABC transporter substrate-binding protein [Acetobacter sp.]|uniref:ABC transporter substrate-binding protein n=1 Tax=Acetobacter sp. TaxID=440 RepID=UPI0039EBF349
MNDIFYYTRCPAPTAVGVGAATRDLQQLIEASGLTPQALQDAPDPAIRRHHFEHGIANLLREGGNIPAIWARSRGARTRLLGITWLDEFQAILVRADSPAVSVRDLAGLRFAVPDNQRQTLDVARISVLRGIQQALRSAGLEPKDVQLVDLPGGWSTSPGERGVEQFDAELQALNEGRVDAVWVKSAAGAAAVRSGMYRVLLRIDTLPDPSLRINNGTPRTLTFHEDFLAARPALAAGVVNQITKAVVDIGDDRQRLWSLLADETGQAVEDAEAAFTRFQADNLIPRLTPERVSALQEQADFLFAEGFILQPVNVSEWALDPSTLLPVS